jgi:hypothetical protein
MREIHTYAQSHNVSPISFVEDDNLVSASKKDGEQKEKVLNFLSFRKVQTMKGGRVIYCSSRTYRPGGSVTLFMAKLLIRLRTTYERSRYRYIQKVAIGAMTNIT